MPHAVAMIHARPESFQGQLRPLRGNGFDACRAKLLSVDLSASAVDIQQN
jgi:hypothetical protein